MKAIVVTIIGGQLKGFGQTLKALDPNTTGKDDLFGFILDASGDAALNFSNSDDSKFRKAMRAINEATGKYLAETGSDQP